jgi:hypothetical protein
VSVIALKLFALSHTRIPARVGDLSGKSTGNISKKILSMLTSYACECFVTNVLCERLIFLKQTPVYSTIICFFTECVAVNIPNIKYRMPDQLIVLEEYIRYR